MSCGLPIGKELFSMNAKLVFLVLILIFVGATLPVPGNFAGTARAAGTDYTLVAICGAGYYNADFCEGCSVRDFDRCVMRDCDRCVRSPYVSGFYCDLYGCSWLREYGCPSCVVR
jgi:hypothetical protein